MGCTEEEITIESYVDASIADYFSRFESEAALRNQALDLSELGIGAYIESLDNDIIGQCATLSNGGKEVRVSAKFWDKASDTEKEFLIFHELGHCALLRSHDDTADVHGRCMSIMNSGLGKCQSIYNAASRATLLDELFLQ